MAWLRDAAKPARVFGKLVRAGLAVALFAHALLFVVVFFASLALTRTNPHATALMIYRRLTLHQAELPVRLVALRQIPRPLRNMVVRLEDYSFYRNAGVDLGALRDAWETNVSIGRAAVGGSTITMQLARNLFLTPRKTYLRKYMEILIALEMDLLLSKDRILELYLNCIEWGRGVFGVGAASVYYYGTGVDSLSLDQMRRLATIITNPLRYNVDTFPDSRQMAERYAFLLARFPDEEAPAAPEVTPTAEGPVPRGAEVPDPPAASQEISPAAPPASGSEAPAPGGSPQPTASDTAARPTPGAGSE